jgi:hypothetical protein
MHPELLWVFLNGGLLGPICPSIPRMHVKNGIMQFIKIIKQQGRS